MKIGNKSIQGIYKYSETCTPEIDDFVLYNGYLWVCKVDSPSSAPSKNSTEWSLYMSPDIMGVDEIDDIIDLLKSENQQWPEKAIIAGALPSILDSVYHGLNGKGIIFAGDLSIDNIVSDTDHPYGIYPISRLKTSGVNSTSYNPDLLGLVSITEENKDIPVFLKKYTYKSSTGDTYSLLELCDYLDGTLWFKIYTPGSTNNLMSWRCASPGNSMKSTIETLVNQYRARISELDSIEYTIRDSFRFTKLTFPDSSSSTCKYISIGSGVSENAGSANVYPSIPDGTKLDYTVVVTIKDTSTGMWYSESVTVPGTDSKNVYINVKGLPDPLYLSIIVQPSNRITFSLQDIPDGYAGYIESIYYQDFYER